jgi:SAM-dependent methyltransferase
VVHCPICGSTAFTAFSSRPDARCLGCDALERQRALARVLEERADEVRGRSCLEAGPLSPRVFGGYLRERGWDYVAIDRWRTGNPRDPRSVGFIDHEADLADLSRFGDASFSLFLTQHVIEEIPRYERALAEIARVLGPGGIALMEIPFKRALDRTRPAQENRFGNVWEFGRDLPDRVAEHFASVEAVPLREGSYAGELLVAHVG